METILFSLIVLLSIATSLFALLALGDLIRPLQKLPRNLCWFFAGVGTIWLYRMGSELGAHWLAVCRRFVEDLLL